jgi:hypothetical protein
MPQIGPSARPTVVAFLHELDEMRREGMNVDQIVREVATDFSRVQVLEWTSGMGIRYRFLIQQLDADGVPLFEVRNKLILKEFT